MIAPKRARVLGRSAFRPAAWALSLTAHATAAALLLGTPMQVRPEQKRPEETVEAVYATAPPEPEGANAGPAEAEPPDLPPAEAAASAAPPPSPVSEPAPPPPAPPSEPDAPTVLAPQPAAQPPAELSVPPSPPQREPAPLSAAVIPPASPPRRPAPRPAPTKPVQRRQLPAGPAITTRDESAAARPAPASAQPAVLAC